VVLCVWSYLSFKLSCRDLVAMIIGRTSEYARASQFLLNDVDRAFLGQ
jgi:hypothetical protein